MAMLLERLEDLSIKYWLESLFSSAPFVKIVDGYPTDDLEIPSISVEADTIDVKPGELGNRRGILFRVWFIDIYAKNKTQRDEFAYTILHGIEDGITVYDYNEGFPPSVSPSVLGCLIPEDIKLKIVKVFPELTGDLYWRATVSFTAVYNKL